jgi:glycosyltransferase involved in cell wall biosynthesis
VKAGRLRVLITLDAVGGVWQYGLDLARGLAARGAEPVLVVLGPAPDPVQAQEARRIPRTTVIESGLPLDWLCAGPDPVLDAGRRIADLAAEVEADIVHLNTPALAADWAGSTPVIAVTHGCVSTWWERAKKDEPLAPDFHWHREVMARGLRSADRVVAPSASYARHVAEHYGLVQEPRVVHNGGHPISEADGGEPTARALTVGRLWDAVKRMNLLDRVAARLAAPFDAAGAAVGPHGETIQVGHLNLLGQLDAAALGARLQERPVFVSAASFEPFGLAVLEAAQAGCALVLSDIDTFRELWDGAALFVREGDDDACLQAISGLLAQPQSRLALGEAARERAARYHPQAMADAMLHIYDEALSQAPSRGRVAA